KTAEGQPLRRPRHPVARVVTPGHRGASPGEPRRALAVTYPAGKARSKGLFEIKSARETPTRERRQTMQRFLRDGKEYWGGLHRELGLLLYDPRDQQRLAADKVHLYVVAERRRATFIKAIVRTGFVPSRLETWWCPQHEVVMQQRHNARGTGWSHQ